MANKQNERDQLITQWYINATIDRFGEKLKPKAAEAFIEALLIITAADRVLHEKERQWILGYAAICGLTQDKLDRLKAYVPKSESVDELLSKKNLKFVEKCAPSLIYNAFRASYADGDLHPTEIEAIKKVAKRIGLSQDEFDRLQSLFNAEIGLRNQLAVTLFPESFNVFVTCVNQTTDEIED